MQKKQSTMRKAKIIGMLLINLEEGSATSGKGMMTRTHKLRNQGSDATDNWTSTDWKWS